MQFIIQHWELISSIGLSLYEIIARKAPTQKDISLINGIKSIADTLIRNVKSQDENGTSFHK